MRRYSLKRFIALSDTSLKIWREGGFSAFYDRLKRWLKGERRYIPIFEDRPELHGYEPYCHFTTPSAADLEAQRKESLAWHNPITFGIITPVYNVPLSFFIRTAQSVTQQSYPHWRWYIADASPNEDLRDYLACLAAQDERIVLIRLAENGGISANSNAALQRAFREAVCEYVVLLDHDDELAREALYTVAKFIQEKPDADFIYSDEDKINEIDHRHNPLFKPDWSPEMLLCVNYLCHISVIRRSLVERVGGFDPKKDGAQDWDLFLRISELTDRIYHIPKVLYHWRVWSHSTAHTIEAKPYVATAHLAAVREHLLRTGIRNPQVYFDPEHPIHKIYPLVTWKQSRPRRIVIIIPSRDHAEMLLNCLTTLFGKTCYPDYRVLLVDTGSVEKETSALYGYYQAKEPRFQVISYTEPSFNFGKACNLGARHAPEADLLLFLNNDVEILDGLWLERMAQWYERKDVGIVGAQLLYPDGRIQHAGVCLGGGGLAGHLFFGLPQHASVFFGTPDWYRNLLAVTGACLMISREAFDKVGGFDERYQLNYSDVALCLKVHQAGYRIVYTPHVRLIHHESVTHGQRIPRSDFLLANQEFQPWIQQGDPYYNPNLSYGRPDHYVTLSPVHRAVNLNRRLMARLPNKDIIQLPNDLL
jgi:GT2 family glycosyltransferase